MKRGGLQQTWRSCPNYWPAAKRGECAEARIVAARGQLATRDRGFVGVAQKAHNGDHSIYPQATKLPKHQAG